jgi:hypothetical protein
MLLTVGSHAQRYIMERRASFFVTSKVPKFGGVHRTALAMQRARNDVSSASLSNFRLSPGSPR